MHIDVKICGLTEPAGVAAALDAGADLAGFVFFPPSPRNVPLAEAVRLAEPVRGRARITALTVDADTATLDAIVAGLEPDLLQLHGRETPEQVAAIGRRYGRPVMKSLGIAGPEDVEAARAYADHVERILFDAKPPPEATRPGGLGRRFDWTLLKELDLAVPCMLSGGLDADSVARAIGIVRPRGVDVSSGVESAPGIKEPGLVRDFIARVRAAERDMAEEERIVQ